MATLTLNANQTAWHGADASLIAAAVPELVWGAEQAVLARCLPLVERQSITLDLGSVERIDAAGIAALITLYATAVQAGQTFGVCGVRPRVAQILHLVGLDAVLMERDAAATAFFAAASRRPAA